MRHMRNLGVTSHPVYFLPRGQKEITECSLFNDRKPHPKVSSKQRILSVGMLNFWGIRSSIWIQTRV